MKKLAVPCKQIKVITSWIAHLAHACVLHSQDAHTNQPESCMLHPTTAKPCARDVNAWIWLYYGDMKIYRKFGPFLMFLQQSYNRYVVLTRNFFYLDLWFCFTFVQCNYLLHHCNFLVSMDLYFFNHIYLYTNHIKKRKITAYLWKFLFSFHISFFTRFVQFQHIVCRLQI